METRIAKFELLNELLNIANMKETIEEIALTEGHFLSKFAAAALIIATTMLPGKVTAQDVDPNGSNIRDVATAISPEQKRAANVILPHLKRHNVVNLRQLPAEEQQEIIRAINTERPAGRAINTERPAGRAINTERPAGRAINPERPAGRAINPER